MEMLSAEDERVNFDELLVSIKSTRNVNEIKEKLDREQKRAATGQERRHGKTKKAVQQKRRPATEAEAELEAALEAQQNERRNKKVLEAPLHRQARNRIESRLAYRQTKEELRPWDPIVEGLRVAEQLQFPHDERRDDPLRTLTAEERAKTFTPRTELELRMAEVLNGSKHAIRDGEQYSRAERELLKAMDVTEAQRKCAELRRMRALMSFQASKLKRQSKIKSKQFHRIRKRQQRRELVKEVEQLLVKDPEQADEKLKELEKDRAYERATLKHRGTNKWTKQVRKFAARDPQLRHKLEDQLRLGRELKRKNEAVALGDAANDDDDESDKNSEAANFGEEEEKKHLVTTESGDLDAALNPFYRSALENIRRERKTVSKQARAKAAKLSRQHNAIAEVAKNGPELDETEEEPTPFLDLNVRPILQVPQELADGADSDSDVQQAFQAEAYADDDVLGEFQRRKERVETQEKPKAKQSKYLRGWGAWTGPGISEEAEQRRELKVFGQQPVLKARRRKDANRPGVIIREQRASEGIQRLQPRDVPFPFTRIQDYEAYVRQPLGRDWNTPIAHQQLTKPSIVTKDGRIIRPLNKEVKKHKQMMADIIGENI
uniref:U3 small nucleolar RNA-associated protein 14 n=1 Tax=Globodera rostochiensis TaxID=31243 RepID=A0A914HNB3_GLORO